MYLLYDILLLVSALFLIPLYLLRALRYGKLRQGVRQRFGIYAPGRLAPLAGREVFWIHAASVGEARAAIPLVQALRSAYPEVALVFTSVTETGHEIARGIPQLDLCLFSPFDLSWVVRRVLGKLRPSLVVIVETEIWPNFVRLSEARGVPVVLVNGRISDRSFPRYRMGRFFLAPILRKFAAFCMQSEQDAERVRLMGAPAERVEVSRNLKFDMEAPLPDAGQVAALKELYRLPEETLVWVAGSTHAGEEETVVGIYRRLLEGGESLLLVLVPRHPERCRALAEQLRGRGFAVTLRSELEEGRAFLAPGEILLIDGVGELMQLYAVADLVFVGGSLVPVGGHNVLEAALLKKPVLFGPYMHNFKEIAKLLEACSGGLCVADGEALARQTARLLDEAGERLRMGERGHALLEENAGATGRTLAAIRRSLESRGAS